MKYRYGERMPTIYRVRLDSGELGPVQSDEAEAHRWAEQEHPGERYTLIVVPRKVPGATPEHFRAPARPKEDAGGADAHELEGHLGERD